MILTQKDLDDFIKALSDYQKIERDCKISDDKHLAKFYCWLNNNPQVLMATGFQEFVSAYSLPLYKSLIRSGELIDVVRPIFRKFEGEWILISDIPVNDESVWDGYSIEALKSIQHQRKYKRHSLEWDELMDSAIRELFNTEEIVQKAQQAIQNDIYDPTIFVSPKLWTPLNQSYEKDFLQNASVNIIKQIQEEKLELKSVKWQVFEEIVAEVLRDRGMEIHLVTESPQGGRDIIARGELIPGMESVNIAVEVKHMDIVDRPLINRALHQNRNFPALMFVTSGRFTSGVIREAKLPENRMRLFLKDGIAIGELIKSYGFK